MTRRVCVTGGAGFIGSHLVPALLADGHAVTVLDDLSTGRRSAVPPAARLIEGSILDPAAAAASLEGCEVLFHLAARVAVRSSFEFAVADAMSNYAGTATILTAARAARTVRRVIGTSTMAVYADAPARIPVTEAHPVAPISPYGVSKLAAERLTHVMCREAAIDSIVLRLFNTYGQGQAFSAYVGVVTIFATLLGRGERPTVFGDGTQCRDFVHVADVVQGFLRAMQCGSPGQSYNIGTGQGVSVNEVLAALQRSLGTAVVPVYAPAAAGELAYSVADIGRARSDLGYAPAYQFGPCAGDVVADILSQ